MVAKGEGIVREFGMDMNTQLYLKWITNMDLCTAHGCGSLNGRGVSGRMETCICMTESLHCSSETLTTLLIGYPPMQNKNLFKNEREWIHVYI